MSSYIVHKILQEGSRQLLFVQPMASTESIKLSVYDEHSGQTLLRLTNCTLDEFERAIRVLRGSDPDLA